MNESSLGVGVKAANAEAPVTIDVNAPIIWSAWVDTHVITCIILIFTHKSFPRNWKVLFCKIV